MLVEAPGFGSADLNRLAAGGGITLRQLTESTRSLERAFFALAQPNGLVIGVARASMLLGVVAFGLAAAQVASEYSLGTLRQLLVRQPRRAVLLGGKMPGTITFLVLALCFAAVVALIVAVAAAQSRHVSTSAWFTGTGLGGVEGVGYAHGVILGAVYVVVAIGAAMTVFLRNDVTA